MAVRLSVIMPALNEADAIEAAMRDALCAFDRLSIEGELIVINDGSSDATGHSATCMCATDSRCRLVTHSRSLGLGASFWEGVDTCCGEWVCMIPGDGEVDAYSLLSRWQPEADIIVPYFTNRRVRPPARRLISAVFLFLVNTTFRTRFCYTNGPVIYRRSLVAGLDQRDNSFFFQTSILVRLTHSGSRCIQTPALLRKRAGGRSSAVTWRSLRLVVAGYLRLVRAIYLTGPNEAAR